MGAVVKHGTDCGFAVQRNGVILLRTATDTEVQAMGNGLVLLFGMNAVAVDWADHDRIRWAWDQFNRASPDELEIVRCRVVPA